MTVVGGAGNRCAHAYSGPRAAAGSERDRDGQLDDLPSDLAFCVYSTAEWTIQLSA